MVRIQKINRRAVLCAGKVAEVFGREYTLCAGLLQNRTAVLVISTLAYRLIQQVEELMASAMTWSLTIELQRPD